MFEVNYQLVSIRIQNEALGAYDLYGNYWCREREESHSRIIGIGYPNRTEAKIVAKDIARAIAYTGAPKPQIEDQRKEGEHD